MFTSKHGMVFLPKTNSLVAIGRQWLNGEIARKEFVFGRNKSLCKVKVLKKSSQNLAQCELNPIPSISFHAC